MQPNMQPTGERTIQVKRRVIIGLIVLPLFFGFFAFMNVLGDPRSQGIRSLDMTRLIAVGACWGIAFVGLVFLIRSKFRKT
jgi:hypothetical protein